MSSWGGRVPLQNSQGLAQDLVRAAQLEVLPAQLGDLLSFSGAQPWNRALVDAVLLPPVPQGVGRNSAEGNADGGADDSAGALLGTDAFFDELQGSGLELGGVLLGPVPILLEEVDRDETQCASVPESRDRELQLRVITRRIQKRFPWRQRFKTANNHTGTHRP